jgi:hypothetical protein
MAVGRMHLYSITLRPTEIVITSDMKTNGGKFLSWVEEQEDSGERESREQNEEWRIEVVELKMEV